MDLDATLKNHERRLAALETGAPAAATSPAPAPYDLMDVREQLADLRTICAGLQQQLDDLDTEETAPADVGPEPQPQPGETAVAGTG